MKTMAIIFLLQVQIGERIFNDILTLNNLRRETVSGTFEVPGAFKVPFHGKLTQDTLIGSFIAKEGGKEFKVKLKSKLKGACKITGQLLQKDHVFAEFHGKKRGCHE